MLEVVKRLLIYGLIVGLYQPSVFSQTRNKLVNDNDLYYKALFASLDKMAESWGNINDVDSDDRVRTDYRNMIVEKNHEITDSLPTQLGQHHVEYLDAQGLIDRYKKLRKDFSILIAHPMRNEGERLKISFTVHWISYKKRSLNYAISAWSNVYFRYDCPQHQYVIDEIKLGGI